jgi:hypothetical protein
MRKAALMLSLFLLSFGCVNLFALDEGRQEGDRVVVEGCVYEANGIYTLTDPQGFAFELTSDTEHFDRLVGHHVELIGRSWFDVSRPMAMSAPEEEAVPTLHVFGIQHVSQGTCKQ